jgi:hypothetical protein
MKKRIVRSHRTGKEKLFTRDSYGEARSADGELTLWKFVAEGGLSVTVFND